MKKIYINKEFKVTQQQTSGFAKLKRSLVVSKVKLTQFVLSDNSFFYCLVFCFDLIWSGLVYFDLV